MRQSRCRVEGDGKSSDGRPAGIALDGPHGPTRILRPGALWLAWLPGWPLIAIGGAARPAVRAPWWDRHLIPLPHAKIALVYEGPIMIERSCEIGQELCCLVADSLNAAEARAWDLVRDR